MCGISIIINLANQPVPPQHIQCMNNKVMHRGPDGEGYYFGRNFAMGHRRLSIIDLSEAGLQPMQSGDDWIIFNGMIYNYIELKEELLALGYTFRSQTDTEVLLLGCQHWGLEFFNKLNGMWAFAWYKAATNEMVLCRDRYGIKPLYFTSTNDLFAAGSEIKQFTCLPGFTSVLNKTTAVNFLIKGWLNYSEETFFEGVNELRGGHYMVYNLNTHQYVIHKWYNLPKAATPVTVKIEDAIHHIRTLFADSMRIRMRADVRVGSCLSGGVDSTAMVSYIHAHKLANTDFATVTSCYTKAECDEQVYSDEVSRITGFHGYKVFPNLDNLLDKGELDAMVYNQDQPFNSASHYSEFQVFKTAHTNKLTVMLDGQGADEYLCGYNEFFGTHIRQLVHAGKITEALRNLRSKAAHQGSSVFSVIQAIYKSDYYYPLISYGKRLLGKSNFYWLNPSWGKLADKYQNDFKRINIRDLSLQQMIYSSLPMQLHSEDRNSMMFSIESRLPFLDHRLVEFIISLPATYKIKQGFSKYVLREAIVEMPDIIKKRTNKIGFAAPDETWLRENEQRVRKELKHAIEDNDIFSEGLLERFVRFINGKLGYESIYFRAIALNRFIKVFNMQMQKGATVSDKLVAQRIHRHQEKVGSL